MLPHEKKALLEDAFATCPSKNHRIEAAMKRSNTPCPVNKDKWIQRNRDWFEKPDDMYTMIKTPEEDMNEIEIKLGVKKGWFSVPYCVKTLKGYEMCPHCCRINNFLDVVVTGLKVHSAEFLKKVFTGEYGYIENSAVRQKCDCAKCGKALPKEATKFSAPLLPEGNSMIIDNFQGESDGAYQFPIYTYRFL